MGKQHVDFYKKIQLRKTLLRGKKQGVIFVPFIGDGDIAAELYQGYEIYGADIEPERVKTASDRLKGDIRVTDCNKFPFADVEQEFNYADFDAYSEPYKSFRSFWQKANKSKEMVLFFTDGHKQGIIRGGHWHKPDGSKEQIKDTNEKRKVFNFYFPKHILPWFQEHIKPYKIVKKQFYLRGMMLYWGAVIKK